MERNPNVETLKARADALQAQAKRHRHDVRAARRRLRAAEVAARQDALQRLGEVVEAVLGPLSPEALRDVLRTQVSLPAEPEGLPTGDRVDGALAGPRSPSAATPTSSTWSEVS